MTFHSKRNMFALAFMALCIFASAGLMIVPDAHAQTQRAQRPDSFADLSEKLLPAVVNISSTQKAMDGPQMPDFPQFPPGSPFEDFFDHFMDRRGDIPSMPPSALGSGFVVDAQKGYIVTNNHVIRDAEEVRVTFHDDETLTAKIIGHDDKTDIAVLQVETDKPLTAVDFGDSDILRVGDWVLAIGNPFGLGGTVTAGIISARQRDIQAGPYDDFLQTDASINRGNSGGPMFDMDGKVIGINTAIFSPSGGSVGIGFAIPSALAKPVIDQIIEYGRTRRGWLGVRIQKVTEEIAESLGLESDNGALVASVTEDGPAEDAGLKTGDVLLKFNGEDIEEMKYLPRMVAETKIKSTVEVEYWRDGKVRKTRVKIGELEKAEEEGLLQTASTNEPLEADGVSIEGTGLIVKALNDQLRSDYGLGADAQGLLIFSVDPTSEAAMKGLVEGDVIVEAGQTPVRSPVDLKKAVDTAREKKRSSILLLLSRDGDSRFVALRLEDASE